MAPSRCGPTDDEYFVAAAPDGFISVANDRVSILAENAEMGHDIDLEEARRDLERALATGSDTEGDPTKTSGSPKPG